MGDIDLLAIAAAPRPPVMEHFRGYPQMDKMLMAGDTRSTVVLGSGLQVDLRAVPAECYGAALVYFTGSKEHNVSSRRRAVEQGLRISEYGVFRIERRMEAEGECDRRPRGGGRLRRGRPRLGPSRAARGPRRDRGCRGGRLPACIRGEDLRGDLHMHSTWSDGRNTIEEMAEACAARGYEYMVISDHSKALAMTGGLDGYRLRLQWEEIDDVRARHPEIRMLRAMEVDILADGSLDLEDEMLAGLDLVLVSLHLRLELPADEQTERILRALGHPAVNIFCHPTGRMINRRKPVGLRPGHRPPPGRRPGRRRGAELQPPPPGPQGQPPHPRQGAGLQGRDRHGRPPHPRAGPDALGRRAGPTSRAGPEGRAEHTAAERRSWQRSGALPLPSAKLVPVIFPPEVP